MMTKENHYVMKCEASIWDKTTFLNQDGKNDLKYSIKISTDMLPDGMKDFDMVDVYFVHHLPLPDYKKYGYTYIELDLCIIIKIEKIQ